MEYLLALVDFILHIDRHLVELVAQYHVWTYLILFLIVFVETGLVIMPFLPGDSLLFATGAIAAVDGSPLSIGWLVLGLMASAFLGDNTNYWVGRLIGEKVYQKNYRLIRREYLDKTHAFYDKHGGKTIIIARFMPIIRTFAPFVAGVGTMRYPRFLSFSVVGNILWVNSFCWGGYLFGNIPVIKQNFTLVIMAIIVISVLPPVITVIREKMKRAV